MKNEKRIKIDGWKVNISICLEDNNLVINLQKSNGDNICGRTFEFDEAESGQYIKVMDWSLLDDGKTEKEAELLSYNY